jgi:uncharacterized protein YndB with AHSA1/START domain
MSDTADLTTTRTVTIDAPRDEVWRALTTPDVIKQWFFGVETLTDWKVGSPLVHRGEWKGQPYEDKGEILRFDPPEVLEHTHWSAASGVPDSPDNYQTVTWTLEALAAGTELTVGETRLPSEEAKAASEQAWDGALSSLKRLLEEEEDTAQPRSSENSST